MPSDTSEKGLESIVVASLVSEAGNPLNPAGIATDYLKERKSPYQAIVAFSGEHEYKGSKVTESSLNGFPRNDIPNVFQNDPYRFLVVADKFQTGYDEPAANISGLLRRSLHEQFVPPRLRKHPAGRP